MDKDKIEIIARIKVPLWMERDKYEPVSQEMFTQALTKATKSLRLSCEELQKIQRGKMSRSELWAMIVHGLMVRI